jgi:hypothetical protein
LTGETKPIQLRFAHANEQTQSEYRSAIAAFASIRAALDGKRSAPDEDARALASMLDMASTIDREYGDAGPLPLEGVASAVDEALAAAAEVDATLDRHAPEVPKDGLDRAIIALAYWATRHQIAIDRPEMWVNALARRANAVATRQDCAAIFALMQGAIAHLASAFEADLERSNPERPWRILILNFAITAIRSGDGALMRFAFDALNRHLPQDAPGFYSEAWQQAQDPGFPAEHRELIEREMRRWTPAH